MCGIDPSAFQTEFLRFLHGHLKSQGALCLMKCPKFLQSISKRFVNSTLLSGFFVLLSRKLHSGISFSISSSHGLENDVSLFLGLRVVLCYVICIGLYKFFCQSTCNWTSSFAKENEYSVPQTKMPMWVLKYRKIAVKSFKIFPDGSYLEA